VNRRGIAREIAVQRLIAVVRLRSASQLHDVVHALVDGGINVIELTMTIPDALTAIERLAGSLPPSVVLGAGTITDTKTAVAAIDAGVRFVVSPVCRTELIEVCHARDTVMMPGGLTPTEILAATEAGADFVKVFPASAVGPSFIQDVRGPFPAVRLVPTGGIGIDDVTEWLAAGAVAVGVGGALLDRQAIAAGDFRALSGIARRLVTQIRDECRVALDEAPISE
jgi:2-dehydro-3-deoxyphosphogluconate aldolase / (4S)-4-hydroxy-2-oxoglutarate aldolase